MRLWFGEEHGPGNPSIEEVRETASRLRELAAESDVPRDRYVEELHHRTFEAAEEAVEEAESSLDSRIRRKVNLASELRESANRLGEHLAEEGDPEVERLVERMEDRQDEVMEDVAELADELAPNLSALAGPRLAGRLIDLAGGLEDLARKPASTVQVLGAEKALFRHLAGAGDPPKHGAIYGHPDVKSAGERRGEVARALAAKLVIAARIDHFSGRDETRRLFDEWERRLEEVG